MVRVLSEFKADVNVHSHSGDTPLHEAALRGHLGVVRVLISEFKADVNVHNHSGDTPLHHYIRGCFIVGIHHYMRPLGCGQGANIRVQG